MTVIYPGSFDPVHCGHLQLAAYVAKLPFVDEVWMMPSRRNPLKDHATVGTDKQRLRMLQLAVDSARMERVWVSDLEFSLPYPSYTINTLRELQRLYPDRKFSLLIGADNRNTFGRWVQADEILRDFGVLVYPRPGIVQKPDTPGFTSLPRAPVFPFSSTEVRYRVAKALPTAGMLPPAVADYIARHHLYQSY